MLSEDGTHFWWVKMILLDFTGTWVTSSPNKQTGSSIIMPWTGDFGCAQDWNQGSPVDGKKMFWDWKFWCYMSISSTGVQSVHERQQLVFYFRFHFWMSCSLAVKSSAFLMWQGLCLQVTWHQHQVALTHISFYWVDTSAPFSPPTIQLRGCCFTHSIFIQAG